MDLMRLACCHNERKPPYIDARLCRQATERVNLIMKVSYEIRAVNSSPFH